MLFSYSGVFVVISSTAVDGHDVVRAEHAGIGQDRHAGEPEAVAHRRHVRREHEMRGLFRLKGGERDCVEIAQASWKAWKLTASIFRLPAGPPAGSGRTDCRVRCANAVPPACS